MGIKRILKEFRYMSKQFYIPKNTKLELKLRKHHHIGKNAKSEPKRQQQTKQKEKEKKISSVS